MEYAPDDNTVNTHEQVRDLPVGRATLQSQRQRMRIRVHTRCTLRRRPPADQRKCRGRQSVEDPQLEVSPPREPTMCGKCRDALLGHMQATANKISSRLRVHKRRVMELLHLWWRTALLWALDRPLPPTAKRADLQILHEVLHGLAIAGPPEDASSRVLGESRKVTVELVAGRLGPAGSVQVPPVLWGQWADPYFDWAGRHAPSQPHWHCPKALALLTALEHQGLVQGTDETPNALVFVKWKSEAKAALILNMKTFNHTCAYKARRFKPPTLEGLADLLRAVGGGRGPQKSTLAIATGRSTSRPPDQGNQGRGRQQVLCHCSRALRLAPSPRAGPAPHRNRNCPCRSRSWSSSAVPG